VPTDGESVYELEPGRSSRSVLTALRSRFTTRAGGETEQRLRFHDTFDWRLFRARRSLSSEEGVDGPRVRWQSLGGRAPRWEAALDVPAFAWDLGQSELRDALEDAIEMRRLLPLVDVSVRARELRVLDARDKTVVRVLVQHRLAARPGGRDQPLPVVVRVRPVKGYRGAFERVCHFLEDELGLRASRQDGLSPLLRATDQSAPVLDLRALVQLHPEMRAERALRAVHEALLKTLLANEQGMRDAVDTEFLHDFRVAVRRTRSALTQIRGVFPQTVFERFREEFAWLGRVTGPTRDLDVYLLKMRAYESNVSESARHHLAPLGEFLRTLQAHEHGKLVAALDSPRYARLIRDWRRGLRARVPDSAAPNAGRQIRELAAERIWRRYRRALRDGSAIDPESPAEALHVLRIDCKKLRYLIALFQSLFPPEELGRIRRELKRLQNNLGDFNDYEVQQVSLRRFADQMVAERTVPSDTLLAMGQLVLQLEEGQAAERQEFATRWKRFARKKNHKAFESLFGPRGGTGKRGRRSRSRKA
jgi:CHAD domain-containing protein